MVEKPDDARKIMNFRVPDDFRHRMKRLALERRMSLSDLLVAAVDAYGAGEFKSAADALTPRPPTGHPFGVEPIGPDRRQTAATRKADRRKKRE
jgi:hypothetical protein